MKAAFTAPLTGMFKARGLGGNHRNEPGGRPLTAGVR